jgi:mannose-6-phosphate isomerase-like protein (cupin superfamily)
MIPKYRFFYHYFKQKGMMTVHFRGKCHTVQNVTCVVPCQTHHQKRQPRLVMRGWAERVAIINESAVIS